MSFHINHKSLKESVQKIQSLRNKPDPLNSENSDRHQFTSLIGQIAGSGIIDPILTPQVMAIQKNNSEMYTLGILIGVVGLGIAIGIDLASKEVPVYTTHE